jgi:hypothetical protein
MHGFEFEMPWASHSHDIAALPLKSNDMYNGHQLTSGFSGSSNLPVDRHPHIAGPGLQHPAEAGEGEMEA